MTQNTSILLDELYSGVVDINFTKQDGSTRTMKATLSNEYVSKEEQENATNNYNQISVLDLEINQWRSFNPSSVKSYSRTA